MKYETAKKLKEAGFPFRKYEGKEEKPNLWDIEYEGGSFESLYIPTLSELIEACGEDFRLLCQDGKNYWSATSLKNYIEHGSTPEEAVANLWLELNKK